jgi:hypothetical protein
MYLKWETIGERKRGMGRAKEGFQVSKRESGTGEGFPGKGESPRGLCHVPPI